MVPSLVSNCELEAVAGLCEAALGEREDLYGRYLKNERLADVVNEHAVSNLVVPVAGVLGSPQVGEHLEPGVIPDPYSGPFDDDIKAFLPSVVSSSYRDPRVALDVDCFLLIGSRAEMETTLVPHGGEWGYVRTTIGSNRGEPEELCVFQNRFDL
jgi:hypothetical protein